MRLWRVYGIAAGLFWSNANSHLIRDENRTNDNLSTSSSLTTLEDPFTFKFQGWNVCFGRYFSPQISHVYGQDFYNQAYYALDSLMRRHSSTPFDLVPGNKFEYENPTQTIYVEIKAAGMGNHLVFWDVHTVLKGVRSLLRATKENALPSSIIQLYIHDTGDHMFLLGEGYFKGIHPDLTGSNTTLNVVRLNNHTLKTS